MDLMSRLSMALRFLGGLAVAFVWGIVPSEVITWLRDWGASDRADVGGEKRAPGKRRRGRRRCV